LLNADLVMVIIFEKSCLWKATLLFLLTTHSCSCCVLPVNALCGTGNIQTSATLNTKTKRQFGSARWLHCHDVSRDIWKTFSVFKKCYLFIPRFYGQLVAVFCGTLFGALI
jgi:hypothetical protein